ncbi:MAG: hypothetical protein H8E44_23620 [Planctomycetes bacterium]|nr:hypothetical protein [Planctomycetota bacterium]MBL7039863.1 hypothetical protein [Pirellulaceae bacterium]
MMSERITRRVFAKAGAMATIGLTTLETAGAMASQQPDAAPQPSAKANTLEVRPYQLMCVVCRIGQRQTEELGDARLTEILAAVREDPKIPARLRLNTESVYRYQNPGPQEDSPEGEMFNAKRDLDIIQKLGLVPGDARPAIDMFERLLLNVPATKGVCGYETVTADTWQGCPHAGSGNYEKGHALGIKAIIPPRDEQEKADFKKNTVAAIYQAETLQIRPHHLMCMSCFFGARMDNLGPIKEDNLFEAIDAIHKNPDIPVTLVRGTCMICPPCSHYEAETKFCLGGRSMALRDQKKDLDVLQKLGLKYGDTLPARKLYELLYERVPSTRDVCGYGDGEKRAPEWSICGDPEGKETYRKARAANLGIKS